jgi:hypothetical protein
VYHDGAPVAFLSVLPSRWKGMRSLAVTIQYVMFGKGKDRQVQAYVTRGALVIICM